MTISISSTIWNSYNEIGDFFIDDNAIGKSCTLIYSPIRQVCTNCVINPVTGGSTNVHRHGGPAPFTFGPCPLCGGNGYKETETTDTIRLRIYWQSKNWIKIGGNIHVPDAVAQVIGYLSDLPKFRRATEIKLVNEQTQNEWRMALAAEPFLHGFNKNRYFIAYLKRI